MTGPTDSFPAPPQKDPPPTDGETGSPGAAGSKTTGSKETESKKTAWIVAALVIVVAGVAGLWLGGRPSSDLDESDPLTDSATVATAPEADAELPDDVEMAPGDLYFAGGDGRLYAERRELPVGTPAERARSLVAALLAGPEDTRSGLWAPLPAGSRVEAVYLLGTTALLDLRPPLPPTDPDAPEPVGPPTPAEAKLSQLSYGSKQELLAVYSLVNTVVMGVEGVDSVQILWDGRQPETLAGHVDTRRPLAADPSYIAGN